MIIQKKHRDDGSGGEWIKLWICLTIVLLMGILVRTGIMKEDVLKQCLLGNSPGVNWKEHTEETLVRIGELFYGEAKTSG